VIVYSKFSSELTIENAYVVQTHTNARIHQKAAAKKEREREREREGGGGREKERERGKV